jgi:hypothetical protein
LDRCELRQDGAACVRDIFDAQAPMRTGLTRVTFGDNLSETAWVLVQLR